MILSDHTIKERLERGDIVIDPLERDNIQPASVDLRLASEILIFKNNDTPYIDLRKDIPNMMEPVSIPEDGHFILHPGEFALGSTLEYVELSDNLVGRIEGKSSLGRVGLMIHSTAGFVDPGWKGNLTLELANVARLPIALYSGMLVCQLSFMNMTTSADRPYGSSGLRSRYHGQQGVTASKIHYNFNEEEHSKLS